MMEVVSHLLIPVFSELLLMSYVLKSFFLVQRDHLLLVEEAEVAEGGGDLDSSLVYILLNSICFELQVPEVCLLLSIIL